MPDRTVIVDETGRLLIILLLPFLGESHGKTTTMSMRQSLKI